jgi:hypothetical protein
MFKFEITAIFNPNRKDGSYYAAIAGFGLKQKQAAGDDASGAMSALCPTGLYLKGVRS